MKQKIVTLFILFSLSTLCGCFLNVSRADQNDDGLSKKIIYLDKKCRDDFGFGVIALSILFDAKPENFFLEEAMRSEKRLDSLETLEKGNFVTVKKIPSGDGTLIQIIPTAKGRKITEAMGL